MTADREFIDLRVLGQSPDVIAELRQFLSDYLDRVEVRLVREPTKLGELGAATDLIQAVGDSGLLVTVPAAIAVWIRSRRKEVTIQISRKGGKKVTVKASGTMSEKDLRELIGRTLSLDGVLPEELSESSGES